MRCYHRLVFLLGRRLDPQHSRRGDTYKVQDESKILQSPQRDRDRRPPRYSSPRWWRWWPGFPLHGQMLSGFRRILTVMKTGIHEVVIGYLISTPGYSGICAVICPVLQISSARGCPSSHHYDRKLCSPSTENLYRRAEGSVMRLDRQKWRNHKRGESFEMPLYIPTTSHPDISMAPGVSGHPLLKALWEVRARRVAIC